MKYCSLILTVMIFVLSFSANAQELKDKVKDKAKDRVENRTDEAIDEGLNKVEEGIMGLFSSDKDSEDSEENAEEATEEENESNSAQLTSEKKEKSFKSYSKFDFVPGDKVIFYDDFADVAIGDFPVNWDTQASGEVVTIEGLEGKWFQLKGDYSYFMPELKSFEFPDNFTLEFDMLCPESRDFIVEIIRLDETEFPTGYYPGSRGTGIELDGPSLAKWNMYDNEDNNLSRNGDVEHSELEDNVPVHYSIWAQKTRLRVYINEQKVIDVPKGIHPSMKYNNIRFGNLPNENIYLGNLRIAVGSPDTRSRLLTEGKFVTHGITFDSGSDKIKPESYGVLKEVATVLKENPEVKVKIIGHTDSDGKDDFNLSLSKKRAEAVSNALSEQFGIDSSRMSTDGKGEKEPISPNTSTEGKENNRRVEFIKL